METETLSETLRRAVSAALETRTYREVADEIGVEFTVLYKFANGADARASTLDPIAAWLDKAEKARKGGRAR